jgi:class 3 adenylate cyclase/CheY-like chemotaxis protein
MTTILIVEDDDATRSIIIRLLEREGYETRAAADGRLGLEQAAQVRPDVVISDVGMPVMDGFELVEALRAYPALAATPVMLLTALGDRASVRRGMTAGADDYLAKPFAPAELLAALDGLLKKRARIEDSIDSAVKLREDGLQRDLGDNPGGPVPADELAEVLPDEDIADREVDATVLFADIRNFTSLAEKLSSSEAAELLAAYFERACEPVLQNGGLHLKLIGDGLMSIFMDGDPEGAPRPAARRAVAAALGMALASHEFRDWVDQRFGRRELPPFAIGVGLHAGEVTLCRLGAPGHKEITPVGDIVNVAARLEEASKELGWTVVASSAVLQRAGQGIQTGRTLPLELRGKNDIVEVAEITGMVSIAGDPGGGRATLAQRDARVRNAVRTNSNITASAAENSPGTAVARQEGEEPGD